MQPPKEKMKRQEQTRANHAGRRLPAPHRMSAILGLIGAAVTLTLLPAAAADAGTQAESQAGSRPVGPAMHQVEVRLPDTPSRVVERIFAVFSRAIKERTGIEPLRGKRGKLVFGLQNGLGTEGYEIADGPNGEIRISGNDELGLLYGVGAFLQASRYEPGRFQPSCVRGKSAPASLVRIAYIPPHIGNWYETAPHEAVQRYIEELGLWGYNAIMVCFPTEQFESFSDPKAQRMTAHLLQILGAAKQIGLKTGLIHCGNCTYKSMPASLKAVSCPQMTSVGIHACPHKPGAHERLMREFGEILAAYRSVGLDFLCLWPYDNGGCACEYCRPWGCNGFVSLSKDMAAEFRKFNPKGELILSSWRFIADEWHGLYGALEEDSGWVQFILANSSRDSVFWGDLAKENEETIRQGPPGKLPLLVFPEITMAGMWPWGGRGATFRVAAAQQDIAQARRLGAVGIIPYSEGIYDDVGKVIWVQAFWDPKRSMNESLQEYVRYEYAPQLLPQILEVIKLLDTMQENAVRDKVFSPLEASRAKQCADFVDRVEPTLPAYVRTGWRWKLFALRCRLEACLRQGRAFQPNGSYTEEAQRYINDIAKIYCVDERTMAFTRPGIVDRNPVKKQQAVGDEVPGAKQPKKQSGKAN